MATLNIHPVQILSSLGWGLAYIAILFLIWSFGTIVYNLLFHPLARQYPGPLLGQASVLYQTYHELTGQMPHTLTTLHQRYGQLCELPRMSYHTTIHRPYKRSTKQGRYSSLFKDPTFYGPGANHTPSILICSDEDHRRFRTLLNAAFTSKAVMSQETLLTSHVDKLIYGLLDKTHDSPTKTSHENLTIWFDSFGLDVISDLTYGKSFNCLNAKGSPTRETSIIAGSLKASTWYRAIRRMPAPVQTFIHAFLPSTITKIRQARMKYSIQKIFERMQDTTERPDVYYHISTSENKKTMSETEIASSLSILMAAGSETTATTLAGCIYLLLSNPDSWRKLEDEIFSHFTSESEICLARLSGCHTLSAILEETMRLYPPTPSTLPRRVPASGAVICDKPIPAHTVVGVSHWVINRSPRHFGHATEFRPERWMGDERFRGDDKAAFKPFMLGARNCVGQRLADAELRLVIARLVWNFELGLEEGGEGWMVQRAFTLWAKKALWVRVRRRG